jgi:hypothetical protein
MKPAMIDVEAAKPLVEWKSLFATEVCQRAKRLAAQSGQPNSITLSHDRMAAKMALQVLSDAIHGEQQSDGEQEAAVSPHRRRNRSRTRQGTGPFFGQFEYFGGKDGGRKHRPVPLSSVGVNGYSASHRGSISEDSPGTLPTSPS